MTCPICKDTKWVVTEDGKSGSKLVSAPAPVNDDPTNATPCPNCKRQTIIDLIHDGLLEVYHDGITHFVMHHSIRYNLTNEESGDLSGGHGNDAFTIAILHGWDRILSAVGIKSGAAEKK